MIRATEEKDVGWNSLGIAIWAQGTEVRKSGLTRSGLIHPRTSLGNGDSSAVILRQEGGWQFICVFL